MFWNFCVGWRHYVNIWTVWYMTSWNQISRMFETRKFVLALYIGNKCFSVITINIISTCNAWKYLTNSVGTREIRDCKPNSLIVILLLIRGFTSFRRSDLLLLVLSCDSVYLANKTPTISQMILVYFKTMWHKTAKSVLMNLSCLMLMRQNEYL